MDGTILASQPAPASAAAARPAHVDFASTLLAARELALIVVQLLLCTILVWQFELESKRHLLWALAFASAGFVVNVFLRPAWRPAWFSIVSAASVIAVLEWSDGLYALAVAGSLLAAAALPVPYWPRVGLIVAMAGALTSMRSQSTALFWPVVGSMFMFRMVSYLQALRHGRGPRSFPETASFFLMLPNAFFPLFPVVDAKVFRDTWYNDEPRVIYQTGVHWIATGLLHLFLYRVIKYEVLPSPMSVRTLRDVVLYLAMNYGLYVRISGLFHIICGVLHLFGWNLPRTHDRYFLATSFSDIWRRINIYWKDFLTKTFFYPAYFRLRNSELLKGGARETVAIVIGVLWVFVWTWLAHTWQTFWILGRAPFLRKDAVLWLSVGTFVAVNSLLDFRRAKHPRPAKLSIGKRALHAVQALAMFSLVSLFWAAWSNPDVLRYMIYTAREAPVTLQDFLWITAWAGAFVAVAMFVGTCSNRAREKRTVDAAGWFDRSAGRHLAVLTPLVLVALLPLVDTLPEKYALHWIDLRKDQLTAGDALATIDGYYEQLNEGGLQAGPFASRGDVSNQTRFAGEFLSMVRPRRDVMQIELIPGWQGEFDGAKTTVNRWGMRDKPRALQKPAGTYRIALVGSSIVMGLGVDDDHTIAQELERRLNASGGALHYEVLNFGIGRVYAVERRALIEKKVLSFDPDLVLYFAHQDELFHFGKMMAGAHARGFSFEDPALEKFLKEHGLKPGISDYEAEAVITKQAGPVLELTYERMTSLCRGAGATPAFVYLPIPGDHEIPSDPKVVIGLAEKAGMIPIDLSDWWGNHPLDEVVGVIDKYHPRNLGTALIAEDLKVQLHAKKLDRPNAGD